MQAEREYYFSVLKENISYDCLCAQNKDDKGIIDDLLSIMLEVICSRKPTVRVNSEDLAAELVKNKFLKLNGEHISYVLTSLQKSTSNVHNIRAYLITTLYNAPNTIDSYYQARVNHDMYATQTIFIGREQLTICTVRIGGSTMTNESSIKILAITDLRDWNKGELELIDGLEYDCCCLLGDIPETALKIIKQLVHKPLYGVLGNHDDLNSLSRCGITYLNGKAVTVNGVSIAGLSGSHRYKNGDYPMLTQKESIVAAAACPAADILISHDTAYHIMKQLDNAHCGLKGISRYISRTKTGLNICSHYHINSHKRLMYKGCDILCVYKCALVSFPENTAKIIF